MDGIIDIINNTMTVLLKKNKIRGESRFQRGIKRENRNCEDNCNDEGM